MTKEADIVYENGNCWVRKTSNTYVVMVNGSSMSISDSDYIKSEDGLSVAKARCDFLAKIGAIACGATGSIKSANKTTSPGGL